jgi:hypothetical protein
MPKLPAFMDVLFKLLFGGMLVIVILYVLASMAHAMWQAIP